MMIHSRHIRWDWQQFVDWPQKSVRTVCGVKTSRRLAGIPGITRQPQVVDIGDKGYWGWCERCVRSAYQAVLRMDKDIADANLELTADVRKLYLAAMDAIEAQYVRMRDKELERLGRPAIVPATRLKRITAPRGS